MLKPFFAAALLSAFAQYPFYRNAGEICSSMPVRVESGAGEYYRLTREDSEKAINCLARISSTEDSWIHNGYDLIDDGYDEDCTHVYVDKKLFEESSEGFSGTIFDYHIHVMQNTLSTDISPPSSNDFAYHTLQKASLERHGIKFISSVSDGRGMWRYDMENSEDITFDCETDYVLMTIRIDSMFEKVDEINSMDISRAQKIQMFIDYTQQFGIILTYDPME